MAQVTGGNNISSSAQLNAGVVDANAIATDAVDSAEIKASAVGTAEVANDSLINEDIKSDAGIVDTKLAQITTAGKVSGSALTSLTSIPAGAGKIPAANLEGIKLTQVCAPIAQLASTSAENTLFTYSLPAGTLGTSNAVRINGVVKGLNVTGGAVNFTFRFKYGSTTLTTSVISIPAGVSYNWRIDALLFANASASAQRFDVIYTGMSNTGVAHIYYDTGTATEASAGALNLLLTGQMASSSSSLTIDFSNLVISVIG